jgi:hypothetical protein
MLPAAGATQAALRKARQTLSLSVKSQPHKWHIWFLPTRKPTQKKPKELFFANALKKNEQ